MNIVWLKQFKSKIFQHIDFNNTSKCFKWWKIMQMIWKIVFFVSWIMLSKTPKFEKKWPQNHECFIDKKSFFCEWRSEGNSYHRFQNENDFSNNSSGYEGSNISIFSKSQLGYNQTWNIINKKKKFNWCFRQIIDIMNERLTSRLTELRVKKNFEHRLKKICS